MKTILVVSYILSIIALILACINIYKITKISSWNDIEEEIRRRANYFEIPVQDYVEILTSSRNTWDFNRKLKKYIKRKNK